MAFFGLFGKDPARTLAKAQQLLERGEAQRAFELFQDLAGEPAVRDRAAEGEARARSALLERALARAGEAESAGDSADAADWLDAALLHTRDPERRAEIEARRSRLGDGAPRPGGGRRPATRLEVDEYLPDEDDASEEGEDAGGEDEPGDPVDQSYALYVGGLGDEMDEHYDDRPRLFREAVVALHEGRARLAKAALEDLLAESPEDPVYRFERAQCRSSLGDAAGASADLEAVWAFFGDDPLDLAGQLSIPRLWAEARLELGDSPAVVERLAAIAAPDAARADLAPVYATALISSGHLDEARNYLRDAVTWIRNDAELSYLRALIETRLGAADEALRLVAAQLAPALQGHATPYLPALRLFVSLLLDRGDDLDLAGGLLRQALELQGGQGTAEDYRLLARYSETLGDADAATRATAAAERLTARGG